MTNVELATRTDAYHHTNIYFGSFQVYKGYSKGIKGIVLGVYMPRGSRDNR